MRVSFLRHMEQAENGDYGQDDQDDTNGPTDKK
jgi:hypothetical protein